MTLGMAVIGAVGAGYGHGLGWWMLVMVGKGWLRFVKLGWLTGDYWVVNGWLWLVGCY